MKNFYDQLEDLKYSELMITQEIFYTGNDSGVSVKCIIPSLMPGINGTIKRTIPMNKPEIMNKNYSVQSGNITIQSFITLFIPAYLARTCSTDINWYTIYPNNKFTIAFIGGDINNIQVIGRYF